MNGYTSNPPDRIVINQNGLTGSELEGFSFRIYWDGLALKTVTSDGITKIWVWDGKRWRQRKRMPKPPPAPIATSTFPGAW